MSSELYQFPVFKGEGVQHSVEKWNANGTRGLRITQSELGIIGGASVCTRIDVLECRDNVPVYSVRHIHGSNWLKEVHVHKDLLFSCVLAEVDLCPVEIPVDSVKMFRSVENSQHVHIYMEKSISRFRMLNYLPTHTSSFWWRAVSHGSLVFQNWTTGRLIIIPCRQKGILAAADTLRRGINTTKNLPDSFFFPDKDYEKIEVATQEESTAKHQKFESLEEVAEAVQSWALQDGVSPWMTKLIVKTTGMRRSQILQYRYSVGVDVTPTTCETNETPPQLFIAIQAHCNEPLSRELKAYPICMLPIAIDNLDYHFLVSLYLKSLWFLRKLYEYHCSYEANYIPIQRPASNTKLNFLRDFTHKANAKLIGGARLVPLKFQPIDQQM